MKNGEVKEMVVKIAAGSKKWRADDIIYTKIPNIISLINELNSLDEEAYYFDKFSCNLDDIYIPNELSFLIYPASVRFDPNNLLTKNILVKPKYKVTGYTKDDNKSTYKGTDKEVDLKNYNLIDWNSDCAAFRSIFKKDLNSELTSIGSLRKRVSLFDISNRLGYIDDDSNYKVSMLTNDLNWPIFIDKDVAKSMFKDYWFNSTISEFCNQYAKNLRFN